MEDEILHKLLIGDQEGYERALFLKHRFDNYEDRHILLYGKRGSGKKDYAKLLHQVGILHEFPFVSGNINDHPERAKEDIFGYLEYSKQNNKAEFHPGLIEQAGKGTLYLHDINLLPAEVLKQLIELTYRADGSYLPVNSTERKKFDVRLILSTDLEEIDIPRDFFSPFVFNFSTPQKILPLNQQPHRIKELVNLIMNNICRKKEIDPIAFTQGAMDALIQYGWPGGIPEMLEEIEAAVENACKENKGILETPYSSLQNNSRAKTSLSSNNSDEVRICFYRKKANNKKWIIGFEGNTKEINDELGFEQIRYLLDNPNRLLSVVELVAFGQHHPDNLPNKQREEEFHDNLTYGVTYYIAKNGMLKKLTIKKIEQKIKQVEQNISKLEESLVSSQFTMEIEDTIECNKKLDSEKKSLKFYKNMLYEKKNGKEEIQIDNDAEKSRSMLIKRVKTAINAIKKNGINLEDYLEWEKNIYIGRPGAYYRFPKNCNFLKISQYIWDKPEFQDHNRPKWILTDQ